MKLVYTLALGASALGRAGSSPVIRTILELISKNRSCEWTFGSYSKMVRFYVHARTILVPNPRNKVPPTRARRTAAQGIMMKVSEEI